MLYKHMIYETYKHMIYKHMIAFAIELIHLHVYKDTHLKMFLSSGGTKKLMTTDQL